MSYELNDSKSNWQQGDAKITSTTFAGRLTDML